jgi:hypothetical protein
MSYGHKPNQLKDYLHSIVSQFFVFLIVFTLYLTTVCTLLLIAGPQTPIEDNRNNPFVYSFDKHT